VLTKEFMDVLFTEHRIDYIVHGDDPCLLPDGTDVYDYPKRIGRFRMVCPTRPPQGLGACMSRVKSSLVHEQSVQSTAPRTELRVNAGEAH
jgi:hypothetical protein